MEKRASALDLPLYFPFLPASSDTFLGRGLFLENRTGALSGSTGPAVARLKESKRAGCLLQATGQSRPLRVQIFAKHLAVFFGTSSRSSPC